MTIPRLASVARFDPSNLFRPASIAVVGLQSEASAKMLANLAVGGYKGEIHTLNSIAALPEGINLTLLALPNDEIGALVIRELNAPEKCPSSYQTVPAATASTKALPLAL